MGISTEDMKKKYEAAKEKTVKLGKTIKWSILDIADAAMKNKKITLLVLGIVLVAVVTTILLIREPQEAEGPKEARMEENALPEVNTLVAEYMTAKADGDIDRIHALRNYVSDEERLRIMALSKYIESYDNLICYTKKLPPEGYTKKLQVQEAYLTFIYSEAKLYDAATRAPSIQSYYAYQGEDGGYYFYSGDLEEEVNAAVNSLMEETDVLELYHQVSVKYQEAIDADATLKELMEVKIPNSISEDMGELLAAEVLEESGGDASGSGDTVSDNEPDEETGQEPETAQGTALDTPRYVRAMTVVNVRKSDSETADKLGKIQPGKDYKLYEQRINGWSKIDYNGQEAFVKSEFLEVAGGENETPAQKPKETAANVPASQAASGGDYVMAKTTVNIRKSANQDSERLGTIYQGEKLELLMRQADGWCKVKYKGKEAYVKSEYVE